MPPEAPLDKELHGQTLSERMGKTILVILLESIHASKEIWSKAWCWGRKENKTMDVCGRGREKRSQTLCVYIRLLKDGIWVLYTISNFY